MLNMDKGEIGLILYWRPNDRNHRCLALGIDYLSMGRVTRVGRMCIALCIYACQRMRPTCGCALTHGDASKLRYNVAPANCSACSLFVSRPDGHESIRNHPRLRSLLYILQNPRVSIINLVSTSLTRRDISVGL